MPKLNERQKMFCDAYLANGFNAASAYREAYGENGTRELPNADRHGHALKNKPHVQEYLQMRLREIVGPKEALADKIIVKLTDVAFEDKASENIPLPMQLKSIELLAKQLGLYTQKIDANVNSVVTIDINVVDQDAD